MKNPKMTSVLVGLGLMLVLAYGYAQGNPPKKSLINTFINNTGQAVGGLHIEYDRQVTLGDTFLENPPGTFANTYTNPLYDGMELNLSSGTVAAGGSVEIIWSYAKQNPIPKVKKWWWTDGSGILVGEIGYGCRKPDCNSP